MARQQTRRARRTAPYNSSVRYRDIPVSRESTAPKYEPRRAERGRILEMPDRRPKAQRERAVAPVRNPLISVAIMALIAFMVAALWSVLSTDSKINEVNNQILKYDEEISKQQSEIITLKMDIEEMMSIKNIEDYAINDLGMQKVARNQVEYINLNSDDKIVINNEKQSLWDRLGG